MSIRNKTAIPWLLFIVYTGMMILLAACDAGPSAVTGTPAASATPAPTATPALRLQYGAIELQDEQRAWVPIAGETTFDLIGKLESDNPWMVTGNTFAVRDSTHIAQEVKVGGLVEVKGVILEDATWLASSIELAREQVYPTLILTGKVDATDPDWVIGGIKLHVTVATKIDGKIVPGTIVRVTILLFLQGGSWDVASLEALSEFTEIPGCTTVRATIASLRGNEVQFAGWPAILLDADVKIETEAGTPTTLRANQTVLVVACPTENEHFIITKIVVLPKN
jgi:hypothetical protein